VLLYLSEFFAITTLVQHNFLTLLPLYLKCIFALAIFKLSAYNAEIKMQLGQVANYCASIVALTLI
jgi:hypothetical protein